MNLYHITAPTSGYDVYSDAVVAARTADDARTIHPGNDGTIASYAQWPNEEAKAGCWSLASGSWVRTAEEVTACFIGQAHDGIERGVICSSFHAG